MREPENAAEALTRIEALLGDTARKRRLFVDFDGTLLLSNSTEEFLGRAKPAFLAVLILKALALLRPWVLLSRERGYFVWRDAIRVWTVLLLMPWTLILFRREASAIFERYLNRDLAAVLQRSHGHEIVILSFGFGFVIRRLIADTPFADATVVASSLWRPTRLRKQGKQARLHEGGIEVDARRDLIITDSAEDDADLLGTLDNAFYVRWPGEKREGAHAGVYLPFYYLANIKRSPEFFIKSTLLEEYPIFILAFLLYQPFHWEIMVSGSLLFMALLIIYEIGYHENDHIGYRYEKAPKLTEAFHRQKTYRVEPYAWYWFLGITILAILVLDPQHITTSLARIGMPEHHAGVYGEAVLVGFWLIMASLTRLTFFVFNHVPLVWRIFIFFPLHLFKYFSMLAIFSIPAAGFALLSAQVIRTWSVYAIRRCGGDTEYIVSQLVRLMFLLFLLILFAILTSFGEVFAAWQTWVIVAWCVLRAVPETGRKLLHRDVLAEFVPWSKGKDILKYPGA